MKPNTKGNELDGVYKTYMCLTMRMLCGMASACFPIMFMDTLPNEVNQGYRSSCVLEAFIKWLITMFYCYHVVFI